MHKIDTYIEIVTSTRSGFSLLGQRGRQGIHELLSRRYQRVSLTSVDELADLEALVARKPDLVFLGMKFIPSSLERGINDPDLIWISEYLAEHGINHTGSTAPAIKLEANKNLAKLRVRHVGLATAPFALIPRGSDAQALSADLRYPLFVKPSNRGGGTGVDEASLVNDNAQLTAKLQSITKLLKADSLVESYLPGREFSVAILANAKEGMLTALPIELIVEPDSRGTRMLSQRVKMADTERTLALKNDQLRQAVCSLARGAFIALGARDYGRIDIRLDAHGVPNFLEANLVPSLLAGYGNFPKAFQLNNHLPYDAMILSIVSLALARGSDEAAEPFALGQLVTA